MVNEIYIRQKEIGLYKYSRVLVAGCGGVGSWTAFFIALSGIAQELLLVDGDVVEKSNLNRTPYKYEHVGKNKAQALRELIIERRPFLKVVSYSCWLEDVKDKLERLDLFLDCRDVVDAYSELSPILAGYDKEHISLSINYRNNRVFDSGIDRHGYTGAWLIPPVMCASLIVLHITEKELYEKETKNVTLNVRVLLGKILGGKI
jgi:hypothetical protein